MKTFNRKLFIVLFLAFITATVIGTLSHEFGHFIVAKYFGFNARIGYDYTTWSNETSILSATVDFYITLGGPLQTLITGTIGLILLFGFRKSFFKSEKLVGWQWLLIFISLFWLRQLANLFTYLVKNFILGIYRGNGDEVRIAHYFQIPDWMIITFTGMIAAVILVIIVFKFIPSRQRLTFIVAGLIGGISGSLLWLVLLGKYILP